VTLHHRVVHGIACSFTLPMILRSVTASDGLTHQGLTRIFGSDLKAGADKLTTFLTGLGVSTDFRTYGIAPDAWSDLIKDAFNGERGQNFIGTRQALLSQIAGLTERASTKAS
jgi:alcohol dehydrogenase